MSRQVVSPDAPRERDWEDDPDDGRITESNLGTCPEHETGDGDDD